MSKKSIDFLDYGIEEEIDPKLKFNSLLSVTVSTIMCLAAKCPLPKSNVETTKLFLSTITDDSGQSPRNIKGLLTLLDEYQGPFETSKEKNFDKPRTEKPPEEKPSEEKPSEEKPSEEKKEQKGDSLEVLPRAKATENPSFGKELIQVSHLPQMVDNSGKKTQKSLVKKSDKEIVKKPTKMVVPKITPTRSLLSSKF